MIEDAIFTAPPRYEHSGAALLDASGKLVGIASLWVSDALEIGAAFPGNMGSVLTPTYVGLENALDLPHASTFCNQCGVVCPVKIPLPDLLRKLREQQFARGLRPWSERVGLALWGWAARRPAVYALLMRVAARVLARLGGTDRRITNLPGAHGWTARRDLPAPEGRTFRELYARRAARRAS